MFARISSPSATRPTGFTRLRTVLSKLWTPALVLLAVLSSSSLSPGLAGSTPPRESPTPQQPKAQAQTEPIAWSELGSKATAQYSGPGLSIDTQPDGTIALRCLFQKLEGHLTSRGLSLTSTTTPSHPDRFSITADSVGREGASAAALPETGSTHSDTTRARFVRPGLIEEYSVSADGVRQDFLLKHRSTTRSVCPATHASRP